MLVRLIHAPLPHLAPRLRPAELPREYDVEGLDLRLGPPDARTHHDGWEARLEADDRVADDGEVDVRELPDVPRQVALEDALSVDEHC